MKISHTTPSPLRRGQISRARDQQLNQGSHWRGHRFQSDPASRQQILNRAQQILLARALDLAEQPVLFRDAENQSVSFSPTEFLEFAHAVSVQHEQVWLASFAEKDALPADAPQ